ncbi:histone-lysine N-methyltransferase 2C isoform X4 [Electrophorus electricus]|uniref:histone-lysine N-methyltransferase 2C isoform X4 n=1 Tax=Electrophorus electricus TaxID=8005 RepID=UPI0015D01F75|nr:histone-lysine N-methyltransferase 2C isoform X4 [Electrophorus electricus]
MSSEDKCVDPSDHDPSPPLSSDGATPSGSPSSTDRRPRGRPRKDAVSVTPALKTKRKSRSRGRAQADDEDSMDSMDDAALPPETEAGELEADEEDFPQPLGLSPRDEHILSPLFQRSVSEDSAGSSASATGNTKTREKLCAFCYCGEKSLLGQGELKLFGPTPGYVPLHIRNRRGSSEKDDDYHDDDDDNDFEDNDHTRSPGQRGRGLKKISSPDSGLHSTSAPGSTDPFSEEPTHKLWDELGQIGLPDDINVQSLFDPTGQCCAHLQCAAWSEGVWRGEGGQAQLYVDKAIDSGSTEYCAYCKRLGASIKCSEEGCGRSYHYPCAAAAGAFQDVRRYSLLCPDHAPLALTRSKDEVNCLVCDRPGELQDQLFCSTCGQHYHGSCLDVLVTPLKRAGWQCPDCKVCLTCRNPGDDSKMLVCDMCDKGYHTFCLQPVMDSIPTSGWRCKNCRACAQCGTRATGRWTSTSLLCECCQQQQDLTLSCHICGRAHNPEALKDTLTCNTCKRWVHVECERRENPDPGVQKRDGYSCGECKRVEVEATGCAPDATADPQAAAEVFMTVEEEVCLEPRTTAVPPREGPTESPSAMDATQEIQVTVTLTEGLTCPQRSPTLAAASPLSSQNSTAEADRDDEGSQAIVTAAETGKHEECSEPALPEETRPSADVPKALFPSPTKETEPPPTAEDDPVDECPSSPKPSEDVGQEGVLQSLVLCVAQDGGRELEKEAELQGQPKPEEANQEEEEQEVPPEPVCAPAVENSPTLDMDTTPASELSFSGFSSPAGDDKGPGFKRSPAMSPDGSAKLSRSPFSAEASPRATPTHGQNQPGYSPGVPAATFFPLTPKIGMGKPAISKRKFSPGRPRVKQVAWSGRSTVSSPSWSPDAPESWDGAKCQQQQAEHVWMAKVGRGSGFPGRRRPRGANMSGRGGRGRSRLKTDNSLLLTPGVSSFVETPYVVREEEENTMHNTVVLFSSSDTFTLKQDMCVVCGSFGQGTEGRLLPCSQCGQCYHPFCVNIKITKVVLSKGWRCLECTVCEACGQASDPGRLLLCDDCDISYHTYCLDPPLQNVPKGSWKCKWCVSCIQCGTTSPGLRCDWQNNYTQCGPCASLAVCPICARSYREEELILQCRQCDRWLHASCQGLNSEEEAENAADDGFDCTMCKMITLPTHGPAGVGVNLCDPSSDPTIMAQIVSKIKEHDFQKTYTQDGVCLTESGLCQLQSLSVPSVRRRRHKPKLKLKIINQNSVAVLQTPSEPQCELSREGDMDDSRVDLMDCDGKSDSSPDREPNDEDLKGAEGVDSIKKRKRKPYRPGIGGFMVRQRSKAGQGKAKRSLSRKDSTASLAENPMVKEGWNEPDNPVEEPPPVAEPSEKVKKRYRKKKTKLEETFPSYLQEAFFGKDLLYKSKQAKQKLETMGAADEESVHGDSAPASFLDSSSDPLLSAAATPISAKAGTLPSADDPLAELVLQSDDDLLGMLSDDLVKPGHDSGLDLCAFQVDSSPSAFAGLDIGAVPVGPARPLHPAPARGPRQLQEEPLDVILSPELDKMVTDGSILSKLQIPELEGKEVEDLFTAVLSPSSSQSPGLTQPPSSAPSMPVIAMPHQGPGDGGMFPRMPVVNGVMAPNPVFPPNPMMPGSAVSGTFSPIHRMPFPESMREKKFSQMGSDMVGPWSAPVPMPGPAPSADAETDTMSNAQRSTLKWEKEETLGELATVAPVLYTNVNFPSLREEFPDWSTRVKQIAKLWRKASSQERAPYVQKARDNRAALRINKVQLSNDTMKRQQHQQAPDPFDPGVSMETELLFKDPPKQKESQHEQEWKLRQGELSQMWGPLKKQQEKVPKSKAIKSTNKDVLFGHSNQATIAAGCGKNSLQMRQKSKQQAKIEATQKLEQVKNEQQQLQQQQQKQAPPPPKQHQQHHQQQYSGQSGGDATNSGSGSPMTPQPTNGSNTSPLQQTALKDNFVKPQLPGTPTSSSSSDDVFLRPQPPPQSSVAKTPTHDGQYPQGSSSQSQSPQVFSPGSSGSRPSSPWDPYAKMVGTPRPPPSGSSTPRRGSLSDMQERGRPSPAHEPFGSPTSASADMYTKPPDTPRPSDPFVKPLGPPRSGPVSEQQQPGRYMLASAPTGDNFTRPNHRSEHYQRMPHNRMVLSDPYTRPLLTPIPGSSESGFVPVFKTPMPPSQTQQDPFSTAQQGMRRGPPDGFPQGQQSDPYAHQPHTPHPSMGDAFNSEGRMMRQASGGHFAQPMPINRHPQRDLYAHAPSTPRPDYSQQIADSYAQPPGTPRPHDPYAQPPGTPSPHSDPYSMPPSTPRPAPMEQFSQSQPSGRRQSPSHTIDPYAQMAGTPRPAPGERYPKSPGSQRNADAYMQAAGTPRPSKSDPYDQPPGTPRPVHTDPYSQPPGTPRPSPMVHPSDQFSHQAQNRMPDPFSHPAGPGCQTPKHPGISDEGFSLPQSNPNQTPIHDPFEQAPVTPCPQSGERLAHGVGPQATSSSSDTLQPALGDTEEKLKQRQRLRQLILKQQQQKSAIRQEKGLQEATGTPAPVTPMHWSQEDSGPQNDMFGRPPPPYPGTMRPSPMQGSQRFPGTFLGDQRAPFPDEAQCPRPQFSRELSTVGIRPQGPRFGFPAGATGQEPFLRPPHQMQGGPMVDNVPPQLRRSLPADLPRSMGSSPQMGLPQHFPPRGLTVQQHNIMGQPFIELRHRAPENRVRLPFGPPNILDHPNHPQRPSSSFMTGQNMAFAGNQTPRSMNPMMGQPQQGSAGQMPVSASMENLHQRANMPVSTVQRHPSVTTTHTHPVRGEALNSAQSTLLPVTVPGTEVVPLPCGDGMEEKLDTDDSAVKDLEDVEVKDLVDDDLENLNLDPVDGKDLDLETNDLHLDDFIESGKFDLIAYTDPELNLEDKKDMFNEELDLSDPIEDDHGETSDLQKGLSGKKSGTCGSTSTQTMNKLDGQPSGHIKQEECLSKESSNNLLTESTIKTEAKPGSLVSQDPSVCGGPLSNNRPLSSKGSQGNVSNLFEGLVQQAGVSSTAVPSGSAPVLSSLLTKDKLEDSGIDAHHQGDLPQPDHGPDLQSNMGMVILQGQGQDHSMNPAVAMGHRINAPLAHAGSLGNPNMMTASNQQIPVQGFGASPGHQVDPSLPMVAGQQAVPHTLHPQVQQGMIPPGALGQQGAKVQQSQSNRPLLLDEQPLLLQDLLDQERQEQQQQRQMQAMIRQRSGDQFFPNIDFDAITDPIMKAKMVALKGINRVMAQNSMGMTPIVMNRMQQVPAPHGPDAVGFPQHAFGQDGKLIPQLARPDPPSFGPGFVNDAQRKQYEEWLQETQQLLQMQQKFLEDQIGAHRKSKKALSAKQRTAKKAGREFPEEDAEQLKQVTEQQSVVQKQLEQIRKQQKEHAELIEEYRVKQQQQQQQQQQRGLQPPMMNPLQAMPGMQGQAPAMMSGGPHMGQPMMSPMQPHPAPPNPSRMPNMPGWHPSGPGPMGGPRLPSHMPTQMPPSNPGQLPQAQPPPAMVPGVPPGQHGGVPGGHGVGGGGGAAPHVKFDDNNPFSEGFQERERRERLREQQERQRVQLMQEVERQRALQRLELEQQGTGVGPDSSRDNLSHMPFYSAELPRDFMQPAGPQQPQQMVSVFPQQGASSLDFGGPGPTFAQGGDRRPIPGSGAFPGQEMGPNFRPKNPIMHAINFVPGQPRPSALPQGGSEAPLFGMESATPLPPNYPGSGQSLIQLYSNIIPEEKGKKKRTRKKKDADTESVKTPSTPHSDLTAPLTPCVSDTSSTPTRSANQQGDQDHDPNNPSSSTGLAPSSELEWQLSGSGCPFGRQSGAGSETERGALDKAHEIKQETLEVNECWGHEGEPGAVHGADVTGKVKLEEGGEGTSPPGVTGLSPAHAAKGDSGNELLKHLLKNKSTSPPSTAPLIHQVSNDNLRSEEGMPDIKGSVKLVSAVCLGAVNSQLTRNVGPPEPSLPEPGKKKQRSKRTPKTGADKPASRWKKRKREREEMEAAYPTTDTLMTQLEQHLTLLPLMEPLIGVNFTHFPPYGSGQLDGENRLSGSFGSASLDGVCDYYSQLIFKQNNLSNPPTPPASLPPTPPPVARPQMVNGFATADELARKADVMSDHAVSKSLGPRPLSAAFRGEDNLLTQAISQGPKTVDVPASLPTPPHTNQEELRGQEHCADRDTPDSFVPSSSPESVVGMEIGRYPDLFLVKEEPLSPVIPILPNASGKGGTEIKQWEVKKEPPSAFFSSERHVSYSKSGLMSIALTLNSAAAENIQGVLTAVAGLLHVPVPPHYEVTRSPGLQTHNSLALLAGLKVPASHRLDPCQASLFPQSGMRFPRTPVPSGNPGMMRPPQHVGLGAHPSTGSTVVRPDYRMDGSSYGQKPQWCAHCKVVILGNGVRKSAKDLLCSKQEGQTQAVNNTVFCSQNCFALYLSPTQPKPADGKNVSALPDSAEKSHAKVLHSYSNNMSALDVHSLAQMQPEQTPPSTPPVFFPSISLDVPKAEVKPEALKVTVKLKPRPRAVHNGGDETCHLAGKRWKGLRWRKWSVQIVLPEGDVHLQNKEELEELMKKLDASLRPEPLPKDLRRCCFCHEEGDGLTDGPARLLNLDLDLWVHLNCALWSTEVYETQAGALINVELALRRGLAVRCSYCQQMGATSGCHRLRCTNAYHFTCALRAQCTFFKDKTMLCHLHKPRGGGAAVGAVPGGAEHELRCFAVFRRVYVQRDEARQIASIVQRGEREHTFRVGSLVFRAVGQLLPQQMQEFHSPAAIFPIGYEASRIYWSMRHADRRCRYLCSVDERDGAPEFSIRVVEQGYEDLVLTGASPKGVWDKVLEPVAEKRGESDTLKLFPVYLKGEDLFGLTVPAVTRIVESLPGVEACSRYTFRYGRNPLMELPLAINPSGCARSEPRACTHVKRFVLRPHTLTSSSSSTKALQSNGSPAELTGAPYSKQFVHSKSSQYRRMKAEWKSNVYLARSRIQGLGLYAARDIEKYTMVIEYIGTIIRNEVANRKEKMYEAQNRGVYMFRIDSEHVIDATITGGPARYINHSCAPNCIAEVVTFERGHKIIISSNRRIQRGEELCYDYKFDLEDDQHKIPCHCGAVNCRKWMN